MSDIVNKISEVLALKTFKPNTYSPVVLAYIGDSVYELIVRTMIVSEGSKAVAKMHNEARGYVNANAQATMYHAVLPYLSEEEQDVLKRGRNAKSGRAPKSADLQTYKHATGFEALIGYLYISDRVDRVIELIHIGIKAYNEGKKDK